MKKTKLLTPILGVVAISTAVGPIATSCSSQTTETNVIPTSYLNIVGHRLKGFNKNVDISKYDTLVIPDTVKYINDEAFKDTFIPGSKGAFIRKIVFPNTIKYIGKSAFQHCGVITTLDFSSWTIDNIRYCDMASEEGTKAFEYWSDNGTVITNSDISKETREELEDRLYNAGLWKTWFAEESTDKITPDSSWMTQNTETGEAYFQFQLNQDLPKDAENHMYGAVIWKDGTKDVSAIAPVLKREVVFDQEGNKFSFPVRLVNHAKIGDYAEFDMSFGLLSKSSHDEELKPIWKQRLSGFKLNLINNVVTSVDVTGDKSTIETDEKLQLTATVSPEDATNKNVTWSSDHPEIATVDQNGLVTGIAKGSAKITCTALGGLEVTDTYELNVEQGPYNLTLTSWNDLNPFCYMSLDSQGEYLPIPAKKDELITFKTTLINGKDNTLVVPDQLRCRDSSCTINPNSIVIKCNDKVLTKDEDYLLEKSNVIIQFNPNYKWNLNDVVEITLSFTGDIDDVYPLLIMEPAASDFDASAEAKTILPIETGIVGGSGGVSGLFTSTWGSGSQIRLNQEVKPNKYFASELILGRWTTDYGKPTDELWPESEISLIYDFEDLSAIDLNTIRIKRNTSDYSDPKILTKDVDFTITKLTSKRMKITFGVGVIPDNGRIYVSGLATKKTTLNDTFIMAQQPSSTVWQATCVATNGSASGYAMGGAAEFNKSTTVIPAGAYMYSNKGADTLNVSIDIYDITGKLGGITMTVPYTSTDVPLMENITLSRAPQSNIVAYYNAVKA